MLWGLILILGLLVNFSLGQVGVVVLDFIDQSNFSGPWVLSREIPGSFVQCLEKKYNLIPREKVVKVQKELNLSLTDLLEEENLQKLGKTLNCHYLISGQILEFKIDKIGAYAPRLLGFKSFYVTVKVKISVFDQKEKRYCWRGKIFKQKDRHSKLLLTPFGIPDPRDKKINEFARLRKIKWGSEEFKQTLVGKVIKDFSQKIFSQLKEILRGEERKIEGVILYREGEEIFINLGENHPIEEEDLLEIYTLKKGERGFERIKIGLAKISLIKTPTLSKAIIMEEKKEIKKGDILVVK
jgi:hypothetical protein